MKILFTSLFVALLNLTGTAQAPLIKWGKNVKIVWSDFKGKPEVNSPFAAMSAVGFNYKYSSSSNRKTYTIKFEIYSTFDRNKSWSKRDLQTKSMLKHEQLHFDIAALVSREFKKDAENRSYSKNYKNEVVALFNRYSTSLQKLQQKYDAQTSHGKNKFKQKEWENLVHQELLK